jgi:hypothetical protein
VSTTRQYERDRRSRVYKFTPEQLTPNEQQPWRCVGCNEPVGPAKRHCACTRKLEEV